MMKYPKPTLFKPTPEQEKRAALKLAKHFSKDKVLITKAGDKIKGKR